jgi:hypothetical protein
MTRVPITNKEVWWQIALAFLQKGEYPEVLPAIPNIVQWGICSGLTSLVNAGALSPSQRQALYQKLWYHAKPLERADEDPWYHLAYLFTGDGDAYKVRATYALLLAEATDD